MNHKSFLENKVHVADPTGPGSEKHHQEKAKMEMIDAELFIKQAFDQDPGRGYELLFKRYYKQLCSHAVRFVYSKDIAEDIVVEIFSQFWTKQLHTSVTTSYRSYLFTSVRHAAFHHMKKNFGRQILTDDLDELSVATLANSPQQELQFQELVLKIEQIIRSLAPQNQKVLLMSRFEGKKNTAIAQELGISVKTVEGHITRGLAILRTALREHGLLSVILLLLLLL